MLRILPDKSPPPAFTLDRRLHLRRRTMQKREWRLLVMLPLMLLILGSIIQGAIKYAEGLPTGPQEPALEEAILLPMSPPRLADAPPLPSTAEVEAVKGTVAELMADQAAIRHDDAIDAATLAWASALVAADQAAPPIPQRVLARDLVLHGAKVGAAVAVTGRLEESLAAGDSWQRLALAIDEGQYVQVLAPPDAAALVIGHEVTAIGRYLGNATVPAGAAATAGNVTTPLVAARLVRPAEVRAAAATGLEDEIRTGFPTSLPPDLYAEVSDERSVLESRPYYYLVGQAKADRSVGLHDVDNGNLRADAIHKKPDDFRGKPFTVTGYVYRAWEDANIARDQPFGVGRVLRVLLWHRDFGQVTELENGVTKIKTQILRLYELALVTDQPAPVRGQQIIAEARFFKFRALPVKSDSLRDTRNGVTRQSDNVYPWCFVGADWKTVPPPPPRELGWESWLFLAMVTAAVLLIFVLSKRDERLAGKVHAQVTALRRTRRTRQAAGKPAPPPPAT